MDTHASLMPALLERAGGCVVLELGTGGGDGIGELMDGLGW